MRYPPDLRHQGLSGSLAEFCLKKLFRDMDRATLKYIGQIASRGSQSSLKHRMPFASVVHHHDSHIENGSTKTQRLNTLLDNVRCVGCGDLHDCHGRSDCDRFEQPTDTFVVMFE